MQIKINDFEGPLDLLLQLIEKNKLDITKVSLSAVAEQYIDYINNLTESDPELLADFLLIAAKLLYIKSRALLPELELDEDEELDLAKQLKMYKKYIAASLQVKCLFEKNNYAYGRPAELTKVKVDFQPPASLTVNKLQQVMVKLLDNLVKQEKIPHQTMAYVVSIKDKIRHIQQLLKSKSSLKFDELIKSAQNKTEIIVSFLGLLELVKQRQVNVWQVGIFEEIEIKKY